MIFTLKVKILIIRIVFVMKSNNDGSHCWL